jgi:hypothetical protein
VKYGCGEWSYVCPELWLWEMVIFSIRFSTCLYMVESVIITTMYWFVELELLTLTLRVDPRIKFCELELWQLS